MNSHGITLLKGSHWSFERDDRGLLWATLDKRNSGQNVLSREVLEQLSDYLEQINRELPTGLVIRSGKPSGFIAGADIHEFLEIGGEEEALELIHRGQSVFSQLQALPCPTLALIDGVCMGGGTELALACDYRIACDDDATRIGLPEIKLGIHPGFGGVVRLTALIPPHQALELMLSGRALRARAAARLGLVDLAQPRRQLERAARMMLLNAPEPRRQTAIGRLESLPGARSALAAYLRKQVAKKAPRAHYPAPYALIDLWEKHAGQQDMMEAEARSVARLATGPTVRNLIRVFFLQTRLKGLGDRRLFQPRRVHVVGAGVMGGDIAAWCALRGQRVTLQDRKPAFLGNAFKRANGLFRKKLKPRHLRTAAADRLMPDCNGDGVPHADVVIEAIYENTEAKHALYRDMEPRLKPDALLATNTSSIPLERLSEGLEHGDRLVGLHFFNPVAMMPLVEIVHGEGTPADVIARAASFTRHIGKLPLPVRSSPGFLVNRILVPYLIEAVILHQEGVAAEAIDKAAVDFGMPMGPVELADTVGLDICLSVADNLSSAFGFDTPDVLKTLVEQGNLGKKSGRGFYRYRKGKPVRDRDAAMGDQNDIQDRLILRLLNESVACLREGLVEDEDLLDAGVIFGTGFAPFLGGPIHYIRDRGPVMLKQQLELFQQRYGERFRPDPGWDDLLTN